jgi:FkbM family methyltransferase
MPVTIVNNIIRNKVFFDVGANNGFTSVPVAMNNKEFSVYAFEPTPEMIEQIESKIIGLDNYFLTTKAVSNYEGKATFRVAGHADWGCSSLLEFSEKSKTEWPGRTDFDVTNEIEVDVIRLDKFIEENKITKIDYLHIDTQGSDLKVLEGLGKYISIVEEGGMEAAAKEDILYKGQNTQQQSIEFLQKNGFDITGIQINDEYQNEVNIYFKKRK